MQTESRTDGISLVLPGNKCDIAFKKRECRASGIEAEWQPSRTTFHQITKWQTEIDMRKIHPEISLTEHVT